VIEGIPILGRLRGDVQDLENMTARIREALQDILGRGVKVIFWKGSICGPAEEWSHVKLTVDRMARRVHSCKSVRSVKVGIDSRATTPR
jgi:hypothetical protein